MTAQTIKKEIARKANKQRAALSQRFFKTGKGEYGEGDKFLGLTMPEQRVIAKKFSKTPLQEIKKLLKSPYHEHRMVGLVILTLQYPNASEIEKRRIYNFYISNTAYINNWDLVDVTTPRIVGAYLINRKKTILYTFAKSRNLWKRRIAILATAFFISQKKLDDTFKIATILLHDKEDLIHKAVGWMLREAGKVDSKRLEDFLRKYGTIMPRTMLRYAIERFPERRRKYWLTKQ